MKTANRLIAALLSTAVAWPLVASGDEKALATFKVLKPAVALELARASLAACRAAGYQTAVAVVDRFGVVQVVLRDQLAGAHTPETARRKAWTAVSFRSDTLELAEFTQVGQPQSGARDIGDALMLGGGIPVSAEGAIVGGVGISGAPGGEADHACAQAGIDAIREHLEF